MSTLETNLVQPSTGTTLTLGASGDTVDVPSGATFDVTGATVTGLTTGKVLKIDAQTNNTRATISSATSKTTMLSGTYTNVQASSKILIDVKMPMHTMNSGVSFIGFTWNSVDYDSAIQYTYETSSNGSFGSMHRSFDNPASTGSIAWAIYFKTENGGNDRPCNTLNPNATDDARQDQTTTTITFMEYTT